MKKIGIVFLLLVCFTVILAAMNDVQQEVSGGMVVVNYTLHPVLLKYKEDQRFCEFQENEIEGGHEIVLKCYPLACQLATFYLKVIDGNGRVWEWDGQKRFSSLADDYVDTELRSLSVTKKKNKIEIICFFFFPELDSSLSFRDQFVTGT